MALRMRSRFFPCFRHGGRGSPPRRNRYLPRGVCRREVLRQMKNSKLVEEAKLNPARIYHRPHDVLRDRRLDDSARLQILRAWERSLRNKDSREKDEVRAEDIELARREVEGRAQDLRCADR